MKPRVRGRAQGRVKGRPKSQARTLLLLRRSHPLRVHRELVARASVLAASVPITENSVFASDDEYDYEETKLGGGITRELGGGGGRDSTDRHSLAVAARGQFHARDEVVEALAGQLQRLKKQYTRDRLPGFVCGCSDSDASSSSGVSDAAPALVPRSIVRRMLERARGDEHGDGNDAGGGSNGAQVREKTVRKEKKKKVVALRGSPTKALCEELESLEVDAKSRAADVAGFMVRDQPIVRESDDTFGPPPPPASPASLTSTPKARRPRRSPAPVILEPSEVGPVANSTPTGSTNLARVLAGRAVRRAPSLHFRPMPIDEDDAAPEELSFVTKLQMEASQRQPAPTSDEPPTRAQAAAMVGRLRHVSGHYDGLTPELFDQVL